MLLTIKLDPKVGQLIKSLKRKVSNLIYRWFKKPYNNFIEEGQYRKKAKKKS